MRVAKRRLGFTLPEMIMALFVLSLIVAAVVPAYLFANRQIEHARHTELATGIAADTLERWRSTAFDELPDIPEGQSETSVSIGTFETLPGATGQVRFTKVDDSLKPSTEEETRRVQISVTVNWGSEAREHGTVDMSTVVTPG